jgi:hypothetical protein
MGHVEAFLFDDDYQGIIHCRTKNLHIFNIKILCNAHQNGRAVKLGRKYHILFLVDREIRQIREKRRPLAKF